MSTNEELIAEARQHQKSERPGRTNECDRCFMSWPCEPRRLADALEALLPKQVETIEWGPRNHAFQVKSDRGCARCGSDPGDAIHHPPRPVPSRADVAYMSPEARVLFTPPQNGDTT